MEQWNLCFGIIIKGSTKPFHHTHIRNLIRLRQVIVIVGEGDENCKRTQCVGSNFVE